MQSKAPTLDAPNSTSGAAAENAAGASNALFAGTSVISGTATIAICRTGGTAVCIENLNPDVAMVKSTKYRV